ncbi:hypothetical protein [Amycolatopsis sp. NPDC004378]
MVPSAVVLAHHEEIERLAAAVPAAAPAAVVAGDPCFDRLVVSSAARNSYRDRLGASRHQTIVFVSSTWGPRSLFGRFPDLAARVLAELDLDHHLVCTALHPNVWYAHSPAQIELWLGDCLRAGLRLVPPARGWQQALLAADIVIGDHGAVTGYAAAHGKPVLLATFPEDDVVTESAIGALGRTGRRLDQDRPLPIQLHEAITAPVDHREVRRLATSAPGASAANLRRTFYDLIHLPEPATAAIVADYRTSDLTPIQVPCRAWWAVTEVIGDRAFRLDRWPADVTSPQSGQPTSLDGYLVVAADHPRRDLCDLAAVVLTRADGPAATEVFAAHLVCRLVVQLVDLGRCLVTARRGATATIESAHPEVVASALLPWFEGSDELDMVLTVQVGSIPVEVTVTRQGRP